jgi:GntP family gluconate:H+ symporter
MNDSGFWVVSRLGGLTEQETLRSWTVMLTAISLVGFAVTFIASKVLPFV